MARILPLVYQEDKLILIDQRQLPSEEKSFECTTHQEVGFAIKNMVARGAPLIGAVAAYGMVLAAKEFKELPITEFKDCMLRAGLTLKKSRPTAVNLPWAVDRMIQVLLHLVDKTTDIELIHDKLKEEADNIKLEDLTANYQMAAHGVEVVNMGANILTHCNTGALATTGYGTALGVIREAHKQGKNICVYVDETRPRLQGSRLTAWELTKEGIPYYLMADSVSAQLIRDNNIDIILVGADRIALNGDTANKIGTFMLSTLARTYHVPFYVVAPTTTIDFNINNGEEIEIEERSSEEVTNLGEVRISPDEAVVYNPAFDVTPNENISGIITEQGIITPPFDNKLSQLHKGEFS